MKKLACIICLVFLAGCSSIQTERMLIKEPELLKQVPLPYIPQSIYSENMELVSDILVNEDGTVERASFLKSSGDKDWDALAIKSILKWKFTPAMYNGHPIKLLVRKKIKIQFSKPQMMNLAKTIKDWLSQKRTKEEIASDCIDVIQKYYNK